MKDDNKPEAEVLEGEVIKAEKPTPEQTKMKNMSSKRTQALKTTKRQTRVNVSKVMAEMGYSPVVTLIHLAQGDKEALKLDKEISAHIRSSAATTLLSYVAPTIKSVDYTNPDESIKQIPIYVPKREAPQEGVNMLESQSTLEELEDLVALEDMEDDDVSN